MRDQPRAILTMILAFLAAPLLAAPIQAQQTAADSAQVLLDASRVLQRQGRDDLARELIRVLRSRWPNTVAAREVGGQLARAEDEPVSGLGRTSFIAYHTALGAWLGVAIPAAFDAQGSEPYGAGLLIGAPLGLIGSRAYANTRALTDGQAGVISFGSQFGMWQAMGWASVLDIGSREECFENYCYSTAPSTRPFAASIVGATAGLATGVALSRRSIDPGIATLVSQSGYWGTWVGLATAIITDSHDTEHERLRAALIGSGLSVALAVPLGHAWHPTAARVRLISAGGLAGGLAGLGVTLLTSLDDSRGVVGVILGGNVIGMAVAASMTRDGAGPATLGFAESPALISVQEGIRFGLPTPTPTMLKPYRAVTAQDRVVGIRLPLLDVRF